MNNKGTLFVVATPIGNISDSSQRMKETLSSVSLIVAEDTRHTRQLLQAIGLSNQLLSYHKFNESKQSENIIERLLDGEQIALVSDAGTPCISDPGKILVERAHEHEIDVRVIPGPCAVSAALSVSGFEASSYSFYGFLPAKKSQRQTMLKQLAQNTQTQVFYESPKRILSALEDMMQIYGEDRRCCLCRELSKVFETVVVKSLAELHTFIENDSNQQKGEIVLIVEGDAPRKESDDSDAPEFHKPVLLAQLAEVLSSEMSAKSCLSVLLKLDPTLKKNDVYKLILDQQS